MKQLHYLANVEIALKKNTLVSSDIVMRFDIARKVKDAILADQ